MEPYIIMCRSLTYAQKASKIANRAGFYASVAKAPALAGNQGCSYGIKVRSRDLDEITALLQSAGISVGKIFTADGSNEVLP